VSFYGGNFLGLKKHEIKSLLDEAARFVKAGRVDSLRFSTRPDSIDIERLDILNNYPVSTIELGVQSMHDHVLKAANRGHSALDTEKAIGLLKERNYEIALQMMVGLPEDDEKKALDSGRKISHFASDFVRIYPTVVLAGSLSFI
ncbi:MAG: radical SAM protein, partial [Deltaproteobacteria bacterium]|nr:radical SAM protein [Deltaproteobacteria bacterium]